MFISIEDFLETTCPYNNNNNIHIERRTLFFENTYIVEDGAEYTYRIKVTRDLKLKIMFINNQNNYYRLKNIHKHIPVYLNELYTGWIIANREYLTTILKDNRKK